MYFLINVKPELRHQSWGVLYQMESTQQHREWRGVHLKKPKKQQGRHTSTFVNTKNRTVQKMKSLMNNSLHNPSFWNGDINYAHTYRFTKSFSVQSHNHHIYHNPLLLLTLPPCTVLYVSARLGDWFCCILGTCISVGRTLMNVLLCWCTLCWALVQYCLLVFDCDNKIKLLHKQICHLAKPL